MEKKFKLCLDLDFDWTMPNVKLVRANSMCYNNMINFQLIAPIFFETHRHTDRHGYSIVGIDNKFITCKIYTLGVRTKEFLV